MQALDAGDLEVALVALEAELGDLEHEVVQALEVCSGGACARGRSAS